MKALTLILLMFPVLAGAVPEGNQSDQESGDSGLFQFLVRTVGSEIRPWAKPIESVDMDRILELFEIGLITFHTADWFAEEDDHGE